MQQEELFKTIFGRAENDAGNKDFLKNIVAQYPYFGIAQFYLLKNTEQSDQDFNVTASKTSLFVDPFFLNSILSEPKNTSVILPVSEYSITSPIPEIKEDTSVEIKSTDPEKKEELLFEPLYATDYFASQGIKLSEVVLDSDKLGKQLKSFTAWLKTMKKVHPLKTAGADGGMDNAVRNLAEKSNTEEDIITEAMAEAFILQGKTLKAIEIYLKLSLLNPLKSAYFVAKIDNLKT